MSRQRARAPSVTPEASIEIRRNESRLRKSIRAEGCARRKAIVGSSVCPPARIFADPPYEARNCTTSAAVAGARYSKSGSFMNLLRQASRVLGGEMSRCELIADRSGATVQHVIGRVF